MRGKVHRTVYYVEGETERTFIESLAKELQLIRPGKVRVLNIANQLLGSYERRRFTPDETAVFVFDTDIQPTDTLKRNAEILEKEKKARSLRDYLFVLQVPNLEGEILRCCSRIHRIREFFGTRNDSDFKQMMAQAKTLKTTLERNGFDPSLLWSAKSPASYTAYSNHHERILILQ